ncbi:hypothetical protein BDV59DRAFT_196363 [Aspergillus ambiguus]|uniref:RNA-binding protein with serine-rich domain 1 n=1 Tax=Aspergillus ambiguus TaxID=176160 RepID=UPI003CCD709A
MSMRSPRERSPGRSPREPGLERDAPLRRSVSPRSASRSPSNERDIGRRNGHHPKSLSGSPSPHKRYSRSRSRSLDRDRSRSRSWSRGSRWHRNRSYSRSPSPLASFPRSSKIVVEKLTKNVTEAHLREIFGGFGDIQSLDLPMNKAFMTNRGTAYILYHDPADAEAAIAHMHEAQLDGAVLNVSIVLPRRAFSRSPPPPQGRRRSFGRPRAGRGPPLESRPSRRSPPRRYGRSRPMEKHDIYRPRSLSRSRSPRRSRSRSIGSTSMSPPRRRGGKRMGSPGNRRRRSPSYSSYDYSSHSDRSRSPSRSRGRYDPPRR